MALSGFSYSAVDRRMTFAHTRAGGHWFWSTGSAWGTCRQHATHGGTVVRLGVLGGEIAIHSVAVSGVGEAPTGRTQALLRGDESEIQVEQS